MPFTSRLLPKRVIMFQLGIWRENTRTNELKIITLSESIKVSVEFIEIMAKVKRSVVFRIISQRVHFVENFLLLKRNEKIVKLAYIHYGIIFYENTVYTFSHAFQSNVAMWCLYACALCTACAFPTHFTQVHTVYVLLHVLHV